MSNTWTDLDKNIEIEYKYEDHWTLEFHDKGKHAKHTIHLSEREMMDLSLYIQKYALTEESTEKLADPKNPEDITEIEERYMNIAKSATNLGDAITAAKEIYRDKLKVVNLYIYDKNATEYIAIVDEIRQPAAYSKLLSIHSLNVDKTNEEVITSSLK